MLKAVPTIPTDKYLASFTLFPPLWVIQRFAYTLPKPLRLFLLLGRKSNAVQGRPQRYQQAGLSHMVLSTP